MRLDDLPHWQHPCANQGAISTNPTSAPKLPLPTNNAASKPRPRMNQRVVGKITTALASSGAKRNTDGTTFTTTQPTNAPSKNQIATCSGTRRGWCKSSQNKPPATL